MDERMPRVDYFNILLMVAFIGIRTPSGKTSGSRNTRLQSNKV